MLPFAWKAEAQLNFLYPSLKFVVCLLVCEETNGSYSFCKTD